MKTTLHCIVLLVVVCLINADTSCSNNAGSTSRSTVVLSVPSSTKPSISQATHVKGGICNPIGTMGECCLHCEMPRYEYAPGKGKRVCKCSDPNLRFMYSSPFQNYLYPCYPKKYINVNDVLFKFAGDFVQYCIQRGCVCHDVEKKPAMLTMFPGVLRPTGPLVPNGIIQNMEALIAQVQNTTAITNPTRRKKIEDTLRYFVKHIYEDPGLARDTSRDTLKKYIATLKKIATNMKITVAGARSKVGTATHHELAKFLYTCLAEVFRIRAYFLNQYRIHYPGDKSYYAPKNGALAAQSSKYKN